MGLDRAAPFLHSNIVEDGARDGNPVTGARASGAGASREAVHAGGSSIGGGETPVTALGLALGALIGLSLGLLGGGGSILTVPIFVYVVGIAAKPAIAMSLPVVGGTALIGAAGHWRAGHVRLPVALGFGAVAMAAAYGGARLGVFVPGGVQLALLALVMVAAAAAMLRDRREEADAQRTHGAASPLWLIAAAGAAVGLLTGLVGIGGGFLIVPALVLLARLPMKQAVGTSLVVIAMNSASGLLGYLGRVPIDWRMTGLFTAIAGAGILVGAALVRRVPATSLKRAFAVFVLLMGVFILYQNRSAFSRKAAATPAPAAVEAKR